MNTPTIAVKINELLNNREDLGEIQTLLEHLSKQSNSSYKSAFVMLAERGMNYEEENFYWSYAKYPIKRHARCGFKMHVPIDGNAAEELLGALAFVKDLKEMGISSKISNVVLPGAQKGKDIVVYMDHLYWMRNLSEESKRFLLTPSETKVHGEFNLRSIEGETRVFVRYCNYRDGEVYDFKNDEYYKAERGMSPLPSFIKEEDMPFLEYLFEGHMPFKAYEATKRFEKAKTMEDISVVVDELIEGWRKSDPNYVVAFPFVRCDNMHGYLNSEYFKKPVY